MWGATIIRLIRSSSDIYFNPRPPCGGRLSTEGGDQVAQKFQSTPPVWGATTGYQGAASATGISIHAPRVGGDRNSMECKCAKCGISIHAPRVGGDMQFQRYGPYRLYFNPRPPCGGRPSHGWAGRGARHFNPRPPCGGRQQKQLKIQAVRAKNRQFLQISSPNSYPILKNKVASLQIILQNLVRDLGDFLRVYVSHLKHQYIFWVVGCLYSKMLDLVFIAVSQVIKTKTVLFRVHDLTQLCL